MKRNILFLLLAAFVFGYSKADAQTMIPDKGTIIDSLTTIDSEIKGYFPRWKVCERDLQFQIYRSFVNAQFPKENLDMNNIEILAAPRAFNDEPFEIITITCGKESMSAYDIDVQLTEILVGFLSGELIYNGADRGIRGDLATRDYCFNEIPQEIPLSSSQTSAIINYLQPSNVTHAFTLSLFEQAIKIGKTGFWLRSKIGVDDIGYHFWQAGQGSIVLQRPLYINEDTRTTDRVPYLINAYLGGAYKISSGIKRKEIPASIEKDANSGSGTSNVVDWMQKRILNSEPNGKMVLGMDFHMPFHPEAGLTANFEFPVSKMTTEKIDITSYGFYDNLRNPMFGPNSGNGEEIKAVAAVLGSSARVSAFYHWWVDPKDPENYFRFDLGVSYNEVQEYGLYSQKNAESKSTDYYLTTKEVEGLKFYKPESFGDWMFAKIEYRNQAAYPFGASVQLSNQILMTRVYIPLFGNWFYLEGKYSKSLRSEENIRPYEVDDFFMISPVLRITI